jgi:hypothetical protein
MAWGRQASLRRILPMLAGIPLAAALMGIALMTLENHSGLW